jgi:mono/diheme cytochrome c family protein
MKAVIWVAGLVIAAVSSTALFAWSGVYNAAADEPHWRLTERLMVTMRDRSVAVRAGGIAVPDLSDEALIRTGAGNYEAMCVGCHLQPGVAKTELSFGLYPSPPQFARNRPDDPAAAFWVIKHGLKMSGMPAWGKSMDDGSIWGMVAFLQRLPEMSEHEYHEMVESSEGHTHGSGDHGEHDGDHEHEVENGERAHQ